MKLENSLYIQMQILHISTDKENDLGCSSLRTVTRVPSKCFQSLLSVTCPSGVSCYIPACAPHPQPQTCSAHWLPLGFICQRPLYMTADFPFRYMNQFRVKPASFLCFSVLFFGEWGDKKAFGLPTAPRWAASCASEN